MLLIIHLGNRVKIKFRRKMQIAYFRQGLWYGLGGSETKGLFEKPSKEHMIMIRARSAASPIPNIKCSIREHTP